MSSASSSPAHATTPAPDVAPELHKKTVSEPGEVEESSPEPEVAADEGSSSPQPAPSSAPADDKAPATGPAAAPPLPKEPLPGSGSQPRADTAAGPPLPSEPLPEPEDDGWEAHWNPNTSSFWFYNRFTSVWQQENPRVPDASAAAAAAVTAAVPEAQDKSTISNPTSVAGGYNPAIHGDYDESAWYAKGARDPSSSSAAAGTAAAVLAGAALLGGVDAAAGAGTEAGYEYANGAYFNRWTGQWQTPEQGVERHTDEAKSRRQMNAYFDVDAAANMHDGRSLKAERAGKKPTKAELKMFKEKRKAKKEEKRRAWLRD